MSGIPSVEEFVLQLNALRLELGYSYREVSRRARAAGFSLPSTTVWDMLSRSALPRADTLQAYLSGCGVPVESQQEWLAARRRLGRRAAHAPAVAQPPRQLPPRPYGFVGRTAELGKLDAMTHPVAVISGKPGVGKTALALHWAHNAAKRFPDGQLYLNLRGHVGQPPLRTRTALGRLIAALGIPAGSLPPGLDETAALLRSSLAGRKLLIVLDDVHSAEQVRPLLPGEPDCFALLTSRRRLTGLVAADGAGPLTLDTLSADESVELIAALAPAARRDRVTTRELARLCGHLPLALRIAAATLVTRPEVPLADYASALAAGSRIRSLRLPGDERAAVHAAFHESYRRLTDEQSAAFRCAGMLPGRDFSAGLAAHTLDRPVAQVSAELDHLVDVHLLTGVGPGRYTMHDLIREFASEMDGDRGVPEAVFDWYLRGALGAARVLHPQMLRLPGPQTPVTAFPDRVSALAWLRAEQHSLANAVLTAAAAGYPGHAWRIADALRGTLVTAGLRIDWPAVAEAALATAVDEGPAAVAAAELLNGMVREQGGDPDRARRHYRSALRHAVAAWWPQAASSAHDRLGVAYSRSGRLDRAAEHLIKAQRISEEAGDPGAQAIRLNNLGTVHILAGRLDDAREVLMRALGLHRALGSERGEAATLNNLGLVCRLAGQAHPAREHLARAYLLHGEAGNPHGQAAAASELAETFAGLDLPAESRFLARLALAVARRTGSAHQEAVACLALARACLIGGDPAVAARRYERALRLARHLHMPRLEIQALIGLVHAAPGAAAAPLRARQAVTLAQRAEHGVFLAAARSAQALLRTRRG